MCKRVIFAIGLLFFSPARATDSAWYRANLYDVTTQSYYIPYQLWTGAPWDGNKKLEFHAVDKNFMTSKTIQGPTPWMHPHLKREYLVYKRLNRGKAQLFTFYEKGIGRVYDSREQRYFDMDIKFPAGPGWKIGVPVDFEQKFWKGENIKGYTRTVTILILAIKFDDADVMKELTYCYSVNGVPDNEYTYRPNFGMTDVRGL